jgi:hypothetical protein
MLQLLRIWKDQEEGLLLLVIEEEKGVEGRREGNEFTDFCFSFSLGLACANIGSHKGMGAQG